MKRKKPPVLLASILVVMAGAAILFIPRNEDPRMQPPPQQNKSPEPTGKSRATPSKGDVAKRAVMLDASSPDGGPAGPGSAVGANPAVATIYLPRMKPVKQQPNDASVQAQWYREGARAGRKEGFR